MNKITTLSGIGIVFALLLFGCLQTPSTGANNAIVGEKSTTFTAFTNNSTSSGYPLGGVMAKHAISYAFTGAGWTGNRTDIALQGSIDNITYTALVNYTGSTNGTSFVVDKPVLYVRIVISLWNATANNSTVAAVTVRYAGTT